MTRHTDDLKQQVERILHWEPSSHWRLRDFEQLSDRILAHTRQLVSPRDLQTFWHSSVAQSPMLLDTLARFADYTDWTDFCARNAYGTVDHDDETGLTHASGWEIPTRWVVVICWLAVVLSVLVVILLAYKR